MSTVRANNYYDASGGSAAQLYGVSMRNGGTAFVNRIINGDMRIDQRNAGASVTVNSTTTQYAVDRIQGRGDSVGVFTIQQSSTVPAGFSNSLAVTVTTADSSIAAGRIYFLRQNIEGYNVADFNFGSSNAKTITLSFWVRSSLTGTFAGSLANNSFNRSYPFTYTISSANTWEQKSVTVSGDQSGTWTTTNSSGLRVIWSLGAGSTFVTTANAWASGEYYGATGQTNLISTSGATFYITGVQLEAGTVASPFERRDYGRELAMCQRYYQYWGGTASYERIAAGYATSATAMEVFVPRFSVVMRSAPSLSANSVSNFRASDASSSFTATAISISQASPNSCGIAVTVASGLTTNRPMSMDTNNTTSAHLGLSAEL